MNKQYTINDFFCGCGGIAVGFQNAGFKIKWACDFDKFCVKTYAHNVGDWVKQLDVTKITWADIPKADGWAFGFPCQDLSTAGKQAGFQFRCTECGTEWKHEHEGLSPICPKCGATNYTAITRSACFFEIMRLLDETKRNAPENYPSFLLAENVKGLKPYIPVLTEQLEQRGFDVHIQLFNSKYWGVPQNRERYFIVATQKGKGVFKFPKEQHEYVPKLSSVLDREVDEKYYISDKKAQTIINSNSDIYGSYERICEDTGFMDVNKCGKTLRVEGGQLSDKEAQLSTHTDKRGIIVSNQGTQFVKETDIAPCVLARDYKGFGNRGMLAILERTE